MKKLTLIVMLALASGIMNANAQTPQFLLSDKWEWYKIADKVVGENKNRDEIIVSGIERYTAIKVVVKESEINMYDLEVSFAGGNGQVIDISSEMKAGSESKVYGLDSSKTDLTKLAFAYETLSPIADEKTQIEIWGLRTINE